MDNPFNTGDKVRLRGPTARTGTVIAVHGRFVWWIGENPFACPSSTSHTQLEPLVDF